MKQVADLSEYQALVNRYRQRGVRSNDYIQQEAETLINAGRLFAVCRPHNLFLLVRREAGWRLYYYLNDGAEEAQLGLEEGAVIEILFRGALAPQEEVDYWLKEGFAENLVRDQYLAMYKDLQPTAVSDRVVVMQATELSQVAEACTLFNASFDRLSGDFISPTDYEGLLKSRSVWIAFDKDTHQFLGALHQSTERGVHWVAHLAVNAEARGLRVGSSLVQSFVEANHTDEKTRYMLWVQRQNEAAVNLYRKFGFKYMNKSTLSLIYEPNSLNS